MTPKGNGEYSCNICAQAAGAPYRYSVDIEVEADHSSHMESEVVAGSAATPRVLAKDT